MTYTKDPITSTADLPNAGKGRGRSEEKREKIVNAAAELFIENGFDGISMDHIAKNAGVSKQTVYSHFGNKEDLFRQCIEGKCIAGAMTPERFNDDLPIDVVLLDLAVHFTQLLMSDDGVKVTRVCVSGAEKYPEVSEMFFEAGPNNIFKLFTRYLQRQVDAKVLKIDNCQHAAWQFMFMVKSEHAFRRLLGLDQKLSDDEIQAYIESCVGLFLRGYAV